MDWGDLEKELDLFEKNQTPATFWLRDDDAIESTSELEIFLDVIENTPLGLAVIPKNMKSNLLDVVHNNKNITVIQHGWQHISHEKNGLNEYPDSRNKEDVLFEFSMGKKILEEAFGSKYRPIFVPPWHGISANFFKLLMQSGIFHISSKGNSLFSKYDDVFVANIHCGTVKWTTPPSFDHPSVYLEQIISHLRQRRIGLSRKGEVTGIASHHLVQNKESLIFIKKFINIVNEHPAAKFLEIDDVFGFTSNIVQNYYTEQIPHFLISYNNAQNLKKIIDVLKRKFGQTSIIVYDNGSDEVNTVNYLKFLEINGVKIFRNEKTQEHTDLNRLNNSVQKYFMNEPPSNYVVADCNIDISGVGTNFYQVLDEFMEQFPNVECFGPMIKINDVPFNYKKYVSLMNSQIENYWSKNPIIFEGKFGQVAYQEGKIDLSFSIHRAGESCNFPKIGIKLYNPYEVRNLNWYLDSLRDVNSKIETIPNLSISDLIKTPEDKLEWKKYISVRSNAGKFEPYIQDI